MNKQMITLVALRAIRAFLITMPIIVIYWQSYGLLVRDIFVLQVIFSIAVVAFEIPSGYFADRFGHARSIQLSSILSVVGYILYWAYPGFLGFAIAEIIIALGAGFISGAQEALLLESIPKGKRKTDNTKWQGRLMTIGNISEAAAAIGAGILAALYSIEAVLILQWVIFMFAIPISFSLKETRNGNMRPTPPLLKILRGSLHENRRLQALNLYAAGVGAGTLMMVWFVQPHWRELGVNILYFGYIWTGLNLVVALGSQLSYIVEKLLRFRVLFAGSVIALVSLFAITALLSDSIWVLVVIPGFWLLRGITRPIIIDYVQQESKEEERATVLSINQLSTRLVFSIFSPFLGWMVDIWSFQAAFMASGIVFGVIASLGVILLYHSYDK